MGGNAPATAPTASAQTKLPPVPLARPAIRAPERDSATSQKPVRGTVPSVRTTGSHRTPWCADLRKLLTDRQKKTAATRQRTATESAPSVRRTSHGPTRLAEPPTEARVTRRRHVPSVPHRGNATRSSCALL